MEKDYWFPTRKYGWGWGLPTRWQGWLVYGAALLLLISIFLPLFNFEWVSWT